MKLLFQWTGKSSFFKLIPQSIISPRTILLTRASIASSFSCKDATSSLLRVHFLDFSWWNSLPNTIREKTRISFFSQSKNLLEILGILWKFTFLKTPVAPTTKESATGTMCPSWRIGLNCNFYSRKKSWVYLLIIEASI